MKFYGIDVQGYLKLRRYDGSLPSYAASDSRRLAYVYNRASSGEDALYLGGEAENQWTRLVLDDGADYPNLQTAFDGVYHPLHGSGAIDFYAGVYGGVGGNMLIGDSMLVLNSSASHTDVSIFRHNQSGANITWNDDWYATGGNQFNGTPTSGGWWTVYTASNTRGGGVATEAWVDTEFIRVGEALGGGDLDNYYTKPEADGKFVVSTDVSTRNITEWTDRLVYDEVGSGTLPSNAVKFAKIASTGLNGTYVNAQGGNHIVKRDANGDIYARYGRLTAITSLYADLAEKYTCSSDDLPIGTVVGVSVDSEFEVEPFLDGMNGCIGVVSEKPALLMNEASDGQAIALTGKVPIRVIGEISKGDFLVPVAGGVAKKGTQQFLVNKFAVSLETSLLTEERMVICIIK